MLYASTRSKTDTYTAYRTLMEDRAPDGGLFVPFRLPKLNLTQISKLKDQSFGETVAQILNLFFSTEITGWDVECSIGRSAAKIISMPHRVLLAQLWDNPKGQYTYIYESLYDMLLESNSHRKITEWAFIAIRISVLFGVFSLLDRSVDRIDISVNVGDFQDPMAAWYACKMGLPIEMVVCACNDNSSSWDFLHRGELNTRVNVIKSQIPELDVVNPAGLERFIYCTLGFDETQKYISASVHKKMYQIRPDMIDMMSSGMFVSVVGKDRVESSVNRIYRSNQCVLDPYTAVSYGSLQDYRAKTGGNNPTVILWDKNPIHDLLIVQKATGLSEFEIKSLLKQL